MYAIAEVYEADARRVKEGQQAEITSVAFPGKLLGKVERTGAMIFRNTIESIDPSAATHSRVVEVWIRLEKNDYAKNLVYLQVEFTIHTGENEG
ncbi:MAG: hypothetical protein GKR87_11065 [Kiritimatiellae bacterium]|nr:hypothetical protein [Kiritimatiellia bacterium]